MIRDKEQAWSLASEGPPPRTCSFEAERLDGLCGCISAARGNSFPHSSMPLRREMIHAPGRRCATFSAYLKWLLRYHGPFSSLFCVAQRAHDLAAGGHHIHAGANIGKIDAGALIAASLPASGHSQDDHGKRILLMPANTPILPLFSSRRAEARSRFMPAPPR